MFVVIKSECDLVIFLVVYFYGLCVGEIGMIELEDVDLDCGCIIIVCEKYLVGGEYVMCLIEIKVIKVWLRGWRDGIFWLFLS